MSPKAKGSTATVAEVTASKAKTPDVIPVTPEMLAKQTLSAAAVKQIADMVPLEDVQAKSAEVEVISTEVALEQWEKTITVSPAQDKAIRSALTDVKELLVVAASTPLLIGERLMTLRLSISAKVFASLANSKVFASIGASKATQYMEQYRALCGIITEIKARQSLMVFGERAILTRKYVHMENGVADYHDYKPNDGKEWKASGYCLSRYIAAAIQKYPIPTAKATAEQCDDWAQRVVRLANLLRGQRGKSEPVPESETVIDTVTAYFGAHDAEASIALMRELFRAFCRATTADVGHILITDLHYDWDSKVWDSDSAPLDSAPTAEHKQFAQRQSVARATSAKTQAAVKAVEREFSKAVA